MARYSNSHFSQEWNGKRRSMELSTQVITLAFSLDQVDKAFVSVVLMVVGLVIDSSR